MLLICGQVGEDICMFWHICVFLFASVLKVRRNSQNRRFFGRATAFAPVKFNISSLIMSEQHKLFISFKPFFTPNSISNLAFVFYSSVLLIKSPFSVACCCFLLLFVHQQGIVTTHDQMEGKRLLIYLLCTTITLCVQYQLVRTITSVKREASGK